MKEQKSESLSRFVTSRLILLCLIVSLVYGAGMSALYSWGLDDSSIHYLYRDAEYYEKQLKTGQPLPVSNDFRQFYLGFEQLPEEIQSASTNPENKPYQSTDPSLSTLEFASTFYYILAYPLDNELTAGNTKTNTPKELYVVHKFDPDVGESIPGLTIAEVVLLSSLVALIFFILTASLIFRTIQSSVNRLYQWGSSLKLTNKRIDIEPLPLNDLKFAELKTVGLKLDEAVGKVIAVSEREKSFVRSFSHELRTPMAIISAVLDILEKKNLPSNEQELENFIKKISKIRDANTRMIATSDSLLAIWQDGPSQEENSTLLIKPLIKEIIKDNTYLNASNTIEIEIDIVDSTEINVPKFIFTMVVTNLIRNALQYTLNGELIIKAETNQIVVSNSIDPSLKQKREAREPTQDYGFGLGLFIVETITKQQNWTFKYGEENGFFTALVSWR